MPLADYLRVIYPLYWLHSPPLAVGSTDCPHQRALYNCVSVCSHRQYLTLQLRPSAYLSANPDVIDEAKSFNTTAGQATDNDMAHAHCMRKPKATNTPSEYVTLIAFPLQQWLSERASMLLYSQTSPVLCLFHGVQDRLWGL
jgi:hypothetical protein